MTYTFLRAQGIEVGTSLVEKEKLAIAKETIEQAGNKLLLPVDHVVAKNFSPETEQHIVDGINESIPLNMKALDIGPATTDLYRKAIAEAAFIVWNGPMGVFEIPQFAHGTLEIAKAVSKSDAVRIVGGGDSEKAIRMAEVKTGITHISTRGGASLDFLAGRILPGVEVLADKAL